MKNIGLGLLGFGTIGTGVVRLLQESGDLLAERLGARLILRRIADIDITSPRPISIDRSLLTTDARQVLQDPSIDIVIELMGGYEPARTFVLEAIARKKHLVTANKALLAAHGNEIFSEAQDSGVILDSRPA
jgi:homoserine dehydrogenase